MTNGGLAGGLFDSVPATSETGDAYEGKYSNTIAMNGMVFYRIGEYGNVPKTVAVDLHTGETKWILNGTVFTRGQVMWFDSFNYDGVFSYLWQVSGSTWNAYDPFSGEWQFTFTNVPSGQATAYGPKGEILIYNINTAQGRMTMWNSTLAGLTNSAIGTPSYGSWGSQTHGKTLNVSKANCYTFNVSIPTGLQYSTSFFSPILKVLPDRVVSMYFNHTHVRVWGLSTEPGSEGQKLFDNTWTAPSSWKEGYVTQHYGTTTNYVEDGFMTLWIKEEMKHYGFSIEDGRYLWTTESEHYSNAYGWGNAEHTWYAAYGNLYSIGLGGDLYCYDGKTGATLWAYPLDDLYGEPVTGQQWWGWITLIADGKVYVGTLEHSAENPLPRGAPQACINASNGAEIWRVNGMFRDTRWGGNGVIADSIIATMDTYDQRVYAIGKGPTQTTVVAPTSSVDFGDSIIVQGSVTDISPGTNDARLKMRFPNGVAAVSDDSQSGYMLHVYKQFECPINTTGVPVTIDVIDSNGNYRNIGTTTSDASGAYSFNWVPDISGKYTVYVTFAGSAAYYGSYTQATFVVDDAPEATAQPTETPASPADLYFVPAIAGLFVLVIIVLVMLVLMMRKRP